MHKLLIVATLLVALLANFSPVRGHQQTERYIPLGQSPGVSAKSTRIGVIEAIDPTARTITFAVADRRHTVTVTERTRIWLDRSRLKQTALSGSYGDLRPGRRVEVKYQDPQRVGIAEWVKVEITEHGSPDAPSR
jgi:hypothetical protein